MSGRFDALATAASAYAAAVSSRDVKRSDRQFWLVVASVCVGSLLWALFFFWLAWTDDPFTRDTLKAGLFGALGIVSLVAAMHEAWHRLRHGPQEPGRRVKRQDAPAPLAALASPRRHEG